MTQRNLVLGAVANYGFNSIKPFVSSLYSTAYSDDLVLFCSNLAAPTLERLRRTKAIIIPFEISLPLLDSTFGKHASKWAADKRIRLLNVNCCRYLLAYCYLKEFERKYRYVMLTDVRDVIFQNDPFHFPIGDKVCCFKEREDVSLGEQSNNAEWLELAFGRKTLDQLHNKPVICSGITIGPSNLIIEYLEKMIDLFMTAAVVGSDLHDQAVHNFLIHKNLLSAIELYTNDTGPVFTVGTEPAVSLNSSRLVVNKRGEIPNVVHQYDRHWHIAIRQYGFRTALKHFGGTRVLLSTALKTSAPKFHQLLARFRDRPLWAS